MDPLESRQAARSRTARDNIVQAALTVFALKGYSAASMDDICLAAGCSKGGLYHHFPTKSAVLSGVVDRLIASNALLPPFESDSGLPVPASAIGRVLVEVWAQAARSPELRARLRAGYEARLDGILRRSSGAVLVEILRIGTLIQMLTRDEALDAAEAARRLGIDRAA